MLIGELVQANEFPVLCVDFLSPLRIIGTGNNELDIVRSSSCVDKFSSIQPFNEQNKGGRTDIFELDGARFGFFVQPFRFTGGLKPGQHCGEIFLR